MSYSACSNPSCSAAGSCPRDGLSRRTFLALSASGVGAMAVPGQTLAAVAADTPAAQQLDRAALVERGTPTEYTGAALPKIGMPVGGGCAGQVFVSGDGRLWAWDVFNPLSFPLGGADFSGTHYPQPLSADQPGAQQFRQGFALRTVAGGSSRTRSLDAAGFADVRFTGQYPLGQVSYAADDSPVAVTLDAFSPFVPLATLDSTIPATVLAYTLRNTTAAPVQATVLGYAENPVCLNSKRSQPTRLRAAAYPGGLEFTAADDTGADRPDVVFEDWERDDYSGWTVAGTAFGSGPVAVATLPTYMTRFGELHASGTRLVTSHNYRANPGDISGADRHTGSLARSFVVERRFVTAFVGGGNHPGQTCLQVLVDGAVVASVNGSDTEVLTARTVDLSAYQGKTAQLRILDTATGAWGHVNVDRIVFSDRADVVFEDWERDDYSGWAVTGDAFGPGPVRPSQVPNLMKRFGDLNVSGTRFVTSYAFRAGGDDVAADAKQGTLTSAPFTIPRRYVAIGVGGGDHAGKTCVNVLVDGAVVATATGSNSEPLVARLLDLGGYEGRTARIQIVDALAGAWAHINVDRIVFTDSADIVFEDWERTTYSGWTVTGDAFGAGPVTVAETPEGFRRPFGLRTDLNVSGSRFATSYNFRASGGPDTYQGMLTRSFTVQRRYVTAWVGGGSHKDQTCFNIVVDGNVVAQATGADIEPLNAISMDVGRYRGKTAQLQIVDHNTGGWGHVNIDRIIFSDRPIRQQPVADRTDGGGFALRALGEATVRPSIADASSLGAIFDSGAGPAEVDGAATSQTGTVAVTVSLQPGETRTVRFVVGWWFPNPERALFGQLVRSDVLRRHYATRFSGARAVVDHVAAEADRLETQTRAWVQTWYADSTLPYWFLERTLATASTLATSTCYRWDDGRFYAWEGAYCCSGTCEHVWNYAQAIGRLFPELERDTRERVDLGIALKPTGEIGNRGECGDAASSFADGQCGTILRIYREHQMSPDSSFLTRNWTKIRSAVEFLVTSRDGADQDGIFRGSQWNTLDTEWFGEIPWISGLYVACLRAASAMATEAGDTASASRYKTIADRGTTYISGNLWNATYGYYIHKTDQAHPSVNTNRGCFVDQMYGQTYASQLGLPRVFPADKAKTALGSLFRNNFRPDPSSYRPPGIGPGRVYATSGEPGTIMATWPNGGSDTSGGLTYFNEVWTGQEYQFAAHLFAEGMSTEGLAVTRAVHDRYAGQKRNPYNEIEASDHYARAMMGYGVYLAACGYEYHGPAGHLGFAPRVGPEDFRCAFTAAEGWGLYRQTRTAGSLSATIEVRYGKVRLVTTAFETAVPAGAVTVTLDGTAVPATVVATGNRAVVTLGSPVIVGTGQTLAIALT